MDISTLGAPLPIHLSVDGTCSCDEPDCLHPGKHPILKYGPPADWKPKDYEISGWHKQWPWANVGVVPAPGYLVTDIDDEAGWQEFVAGRDVPATLEMRSGRGRHLWWRVPEGRTFSTNGHKGFDLRSHTTGYAIVPESLHPNGSRYAWVDEDAPIADAPAWLIADLTARTAEQYVSPDGELAETLAEIAGRHADRSSAIRAFALHCAYAPYPFEDFAAAVGSHPELASKLNGRRDDYLQKQYREACASARQSPHDQRGILNGTTIATSAPQSQDHPLAGVVTSDDDPARSWGPQDLTDVLARIESGDLAPPMPTIALRNDGCGLLYAGKIHSIAGPSGCGKTWTALFATAEQIRAGERVVFIDYESTAEDTCLRLIDLGLTIPQVREQFHYINPEGNLSADGAEHLFGTISTRAPTLVILDSVGESMAMEQCKPNDDDDTARWFRRIAIPSVRLGPAVLLLDHTVKADDPTNFWPSGSQRKRAAISGVQYMQRAAKPFAKGESGTAKIVCAKDRGGTYRQGEHVADLVVTAYETGTLDLALSAPAYSDPTELIPQELQTLMADISSLVAQNVRPLTGRTIEREVTGNAAMIRKARDRLVAGNYLNRESGPRRSFLYSHLKPYESSASE